MLFLSILQLHIDNISKGYPYPYITHITISQPPPYPSNVISFMVDPWAYSQLVLLFWIRENGPL